MKPENLYELQRLAWPNLKAERGEFLATWGPAVAHVEEPAAAAAVKAWKRGPRGAFPPTVAEFLAHVGAPPKRQESLPCFGQCGATLAGPVALAAHERACPKALEAQARGQAHAAQVLAELRRKWAAPRG